VLVERCGGRRRRWRLALRRFAVDGADDEGCEAAAAPTVGENVAPELPPQADNALAATRIVIARKRR
jgi:hypothetical protein